mmetsp:Transcript_63189/g.199903  ORF Transcript_63189/g.199903 Transcript_63189/m.199903 type:complete len:212 (-) Transcript_63189:2213-2848(-)
MDPGAYSPPSSKFFRFSLTNFSLAARISAHAASTCSCIAAALARSAASILPWSFPASRCRTSRVLHDEAVLRYPSAAAIFATEASISSRAAARSASYCACCPLKARASERMCRLCLRSCSTSSIERERRTSSSMRPARGRWRRSDVSSSAVRFSSLFWAQVAVRSSTTWAAASFSSSSVRWASSSTPRSTASGTSSASTYGSPAGSSGGPV